MKNIYKLLFLAFFIIMLVILIKISNPANSWSCTEHLSTITNGSSVTSKKVQYFKPPAPVSEMQIQPPTEKICNCSIKKEPNPDISKDNPPKQASKATTGARGIPRSKEEQSEEAIGILSVGLESSLKRLRGKLEVNRTCDWTDGKWVKDSSIVYGQGILSGYPHCKVDYRQNCKRNKADSPYVGYRWVLMDEKCEAKRIRFTREHFLATVANKTIVFIGDSLTRNMFQALACLLYVPSNKTKMVEYNMYRYRYPDFNVVIEFIKSNYLVKQTKTTCDSHATKKLAATPCLDINNVDPTWANRVKDFDIFVFATGGWWEHDLQMRQASSGQTNHENTYLKAHNIIRSAFKTVIDHLGKPQFNGKKLYWRCSEVSHFFDGEWNTGGLCRRSAPSNFSIYNPVSLFIQQAVIESLSSTSSDIKLFDITKMSSYRQDAHPSSQSRIGPPTDCKHWCLPGVPDHWNEIWLNLLKNDL